MEIRAIAVSTVIASAALSMCACSTVESAVNTVSSGTIGSPTINLDDSKDFVGLVHYPQPECNKNDQLTDPNIGKDTAECLKAQVGTTLTLHGTVDVVAEGANLPDHLTRIQISRAGLKGHMEGLCDPSKGVACEGFSKGDSVYVEFKVLDHIVPDIPDIPGYVVTSISHQ